jgi:hypothetical protein
MLGVIRDVAPNSYVSVHAGDIINPKTLQSNLERAGLNVDEF